MDTSESSEVNETICFTQVKTSKQCKESSNSNSSDSCSDSKNSSESQKSSDSQKSSGSRKELNVTSNITIIDIPYCTCPDRNTSTLTDYRKKVIPRSRVIRAKNNHRSRKPNYYCICNSPNRPCICNKKPKVPTPQKMKREILKNGQKYTYLPNWLVGRLIDIFKEQEKKKSGRTSNMSDPEILALGVKKGERKRKSDPPKRRTERRQKGHNEENKQQQQQQQQQQPQQQHHQQHLQHHGENRNN